MKTSEATPMVAGTIDNPWDEATAVTRPAMLVSGDAAADTLVDGEVPPPPPFGVLFGRARARRAATRLGLRIRTPPG